MAQAPLLQISDIALTFGGNPVFAGVSLVVHPGDRIALVGRNGSGKSTLLKVMAGLVEPDAGGRVLPPGITAGYMEQDPDMAGFATLGDYAAAGLPPGEEYRVARVAEGLRFDPEASVATASGGERRRAALARLMAAEPELMMLDEPTNHLDITAIGWLEAELKATRAAVVLISHDRAFLRALTRTTLWLDRGELRRNDRGFSDFEAWRDRIWAEEDDQRHKLERKIKAEGRWAVEGISARRKRNQGRVRALQALRTKRAEMIRRQGPAAMAFAGGGKTGQEGHRGTGHIEGLRRRDDPVGLLLPRGAGRPGGLRGPERRGQDDAPEDADGRVGARYRHGRSGDRHRDGGFRPEPRRARPGRDPVGKPDGRCR
jgi:ABC transport system ATP-binding/permease protein